MYRKKKALISCTVTALLIWAFDFACEESGFSHDAAHNVTELYLVGNPENRFSHIEAHYHYLLA